MKNPMSMIETSSLTNALKSVGMRNVHRWVMTVFLVLLAYWAVTGVLLAIVDIADPRQSWANEGGGAGAKNPTSVGGIEVSTAGSIGQDELGGMIQTTLRAARALQPSATIATVELEKPRGQAVGTVTFAGSPPRRVIFDAASGALIDANAPVAPPGSDMQDSLHGQAKSWHRGSLLPEGNALGLLTGAALALLCVTGIVMYVQMWRRRRPAGRDGLFWSGGSAMRQFHRWVSIVAAVFLLNQAITGMLLAWTNVSTQMGGGNPPGQLAPLGDEEITRSLQLGYARARAAAPDGPIIGITLLGEGAGAFVPVFFGGEHPGDVGFQLAQNGYIFGRTGSVGPGGLTVDSHSLLKRIHRGDIVGSFNGRYLTLAAGLSLLWLVVSGLVMYVQLLRQRRKLKRYGWFWT